MCEWERSLAALRAMLGVLPAGRERSLAATKLDEFEMWAIKAADLNTPPLGLDDAPR